METKSILLKCFTQKTNNFRIIVMTCGDNDEFSGFILRISSWGKNVVQKESSKRVEGRDSILDWNVWRPVLLVRGIHYYDCTNQINEIRWRYPTNYFQWNLWCDEPRDAYVFWNQQLSKQVVCLEFLLLLVKYVHTH